MPNEQQDRPKSTPKLDQYKGSPTLILNPEDRFTFSFGLGKARLILEHLDTIKKFVESEGKSI